MEDNFNVQVAGGENTIQRERVFCGELYHQMRMRFDEFPYQINIEPDKKRHPIIEQQCGSVNPDLIIHRMGEMTSESNLAVIEVKRSDGNLTDGIVKDMETINCMTTIQNGYYGGVIIIFGTLSELRINNLIKRIKEIKQEAIRELILILSASSDFESTVIKL